MVRLRAIGSCPEHGDPPSGDDAFIVNPVHPSGSIRNEHLQNIYRRHIADLNSIIRGKAEALASRAAVPRAREADSLSGAAAPPRNKSGGPSGPLSTIEAAGREAAIEDGVIAAPGASSALGPHVSAQDSRGSYGGGDAGSASLLRRGKWTVEEEAYALRLIAEFKEGVLPLTDGTTLRTFLAKLLNCDPMRISKKFVGKKCIGKQIFRRNQLNLASRSKEEEARTNSELLELERRFLEKVAEMNRKLTSKFSEAFLDGSGVSMSGVRAFDMPVDLQMQLSAAGPRAANDGSGDHPREAPQGSSNHLPWLRRPMLVASLSSEMLSSLADIDSSRHDTKEHLGQTSSQGREVYADFRGISTHAHDLNAGALVALLGNGGASRPSWSSSGSSKSHVLAPAVSVPFTLYQMQMAQAGGSNENPWGKDVKKPARPKPGSKAPRPTKSSGDFPWGGPGAASPGRDGSDVAGSGCGAMKRNNSLDFMANYLGVDIRVPSTSWLESFNSVHNENSVDFSWPNTGPGDLHRSPSFTRLHRRPSSHRLNLGEHSDSTADLIALLGPSAGTKQAHTSAADMYRSLHDDSYSKPGYDAKHSSRSKRLGGSTSSCDESSETDVRPDLTQIPRSPLLGASKSQRGSSDTTPASSALSSAFSKPSAQSASDSVTPSHRLATAPEKNSGGHSGDFWEFVDINDESPTVHSFPSVVSIDDSTSDLVRQVPGGLTKHQSTGGFSFRDASIASAEVSSPVNISPAKRKFHVLESSS